MPDIGTLTGSLVSVKNKKPTLVLGFNKLFDNFILHRKIIIIVLQNVKFGEIFCWKFVKIETVLVRNSIDIIRGKGRFLIKLLELLCKLFNLSLISITIKNVGFAW